MVKEYIVKADEDRRFSHALTNFLAHQCVKGADFSITDRQLFRRFREFWMRAPECFDHPALLGQFRVGLTQRGLVAASTGKHPRWIGLTLRQPAKREVRKQRVHKQERQSQHA
jgi:hypothetical protein